MIGLDGFPASAAWRRVDVEHGLGHAALTRDPEGFLLTATEVVVAEEERFSCHYTVRADLRWRTRRVDIHSATADGARRLVLAADEHARWWADAVPAPALEGCVDVDVAATPATNTLPVHRLGCAVGQAHEVDTAWVDVPSLAVQRVSQRYTRLAPNGVQDRYEYWDAVYGACELTFDAAGLVMDYQGLAERIG